MSKEQQIVLEALYARFAYSTAFEIETAWKLGRPAHYNKHNKILHGLKGRIDKINRGLKSCTN